MGRSLRGKAKQQPETCSVTAGSSSSHPYLPVLAPNPSPLLLGVTHVLTMPPANSLSERGRFKFRLCRGLTTFTSFHSSPSPRVLSCPSGLRLASSLSYLFPPSLTTLPISTPPSLPFPDTHPHSFLPILSTQNFLDPRFCDSDFETLGGVAFCCCCCGHHH